MKKFIDIVYDILYRNNPNNFRGLSLDEQGEMSMRIASAIEFKWK